MSWNGNFFSERLSSLSHTGRGWNTSEKRAHSTTRYKHCDRCNAWSIKKPWSSALLLHQPVTSCLYSNTMLRQPVTNCPYSNTCYVSQWPVACTTTPCHVSQWPIACTATPCYVSQWPIACTVTLCSVSQWPVACTVKPSSHRSPSLPAIPQPLLQHFLPIHCWFNVLLNNFSLITLLLQRICN
jgi:hypothetical protein